MPEMPDIPDMREVRIAPSILSADFSRLGEEVRAVDQAGAGCIHIDVMDGHFVPNITIGPPVVAALRKTTALPLDVHLMITEPDRYVPDFVRAGADWISIHVESCPHLHRSLGLIREAGKKAGVALNPATPLCVLDHVLDMVDFVLLMTVNPGFGGQSFIPAMLPKIAALRTRLDECNPKAGIEVDGGISPATVGRVAAAGANILVAGSAIYGQTSYQAVLHAMQDSIHKQETGGVLYAV